MNTSARPGLVWPGLVWPPKSLAPHPATSPSPDRCPVEPVRPRQRVAPTVAARRVRPHLIMRKRIPGSWGQAIGYFSSGHQPLRIHAIGAGRAARCAEVASNHASIVPSSVKTTVNLTS